MAVGSEWRHGGGESIPEAFAMPEEKINAAINRAVKEAEEQGVVGKASAPVSCWPALRS